MAPWDDNDMGDAPKASWDKPAGVRAGQKAMLLYIDPEDHRRFKTISIVSGTSMTDILRSFIRRYIKRNGNMLKRGEMLLKRRGRNV